jgi:integrase/recombinase XerD
MVRVTLDRKVIYMQVNHARQEYVRWLVVTRDLSPHTIRAYDADIAAFERYLGASAPVADIDRDCVVSFIEELRATSLSSRSLRRRSSGLRGFCTWLVSRQLLDADPWLGVTIAAGRSRTLPRLVPASELHRLILVLRARAADANRMGACEGVLARPHESTTLLGVSLMVATGVRVSELVSIMCHDIDLAARAVRIVGKGRRERVVYLTNEWLTNLTESYLTTRNALGIEHKQLLFNRRRDPLTAAAMRSRLARAARDASLSLKVTPHMLRHTAATQLIEAGVDIRLIQRLLGHASLGTTEIYTHVSDHALKRMVSDADVLGRALEQR